MFIPVLETLADTSAITNLTPSSCHDLDKCRTIWNIIWSCLVTLFACIWLSIHPNIPAPEESWGTRAARRVWMMMLALLAPELIVGWATRQLIVACKIAKDNEEYGWTKTHGFFAVMGGYMQCDEDGVPIHTIDDVNRLPRKLKMSILEEEIQDRSKGDVLSKTFALLQTGWFVLQCIARTVEGLPVTKLEIATVAFAFLNFATYLLWWNKPLDVSRPVRVWADEGKNKNADKGNLKGADKRGDEGEDRRAKRTNDARCLCSVWNTFKRGLVDFPKEAYRPIATMVVGGVWTAVLFLPFFVFEPIVTGQGYKSNGTRVGTFSPVVSHHEVLHRRHSLLMIVTVVVGIVFGGIHCSAWAFQFPTRTEQLLWRVSAISLTSLPLLMTSLVLIIEKKMRSLMIDRIWCLIGFILVIALYVFARLTLLVLPFMALRSLPPGAFRTADWTRFIPHI